MNPFFQAKTPTTKEMWENEPNKFRHWIILLGIGLLIYMTLIITSIILVSIGYTDLKKIFSDIYTANKVNNPDSSAGRDVLVNYIVLPSITGLLTVASILLYTTTTHASYKAKSFSKLSGFSIYFSEFIGLFAIFNAVRILFSSTSVLQEIGQNPGALLSIIAQFFSIALFIFATQVSKIRKKFIYSERMETLSKSPEFTQMQEQMKTFFNQAQTGQNPSTAYGPVPTQTTTPVNPAVQTKVQEAPEVTKLKKLKISELRNIASQLSISGADKMKKDELIATIIRVTNDE